MSSSTMATISLKLLVNKKTDRVVLAEADNNFVDILFSFLTLPMGTIIRLLGKKSADKCMDKLYESVENLDIEYFETEACKEMLLRPKSLAEKQCENLLINPDDLEPRQLYRCPSFDCFTKTHLLFSSVKGCRCLCGKIMDKNFHWKRTDADAKNGVFVKGATKFIISDGLHVEPATTMATLSLLQKLSINDTNTLEKKIVNVQRKEVLSLLKMLLQSKMPLTDVFLRDPSTFRIDEEKRVLVETVQIKLENENEAPQSNANSVKLKLFQNNMTKKVIFAEGGEDIVDILFSFLTLPLGSIVKLLHRNSFIGCVDNLYKSVELLGVVDSCIKSEECKNMLLSPKLPPHFNCHNNLLTIETSLSNGCSALGCEICWNDGLYWCKHNIEKVVLAEINPKLPNPGTESGGGFANRSVRFMISNDMVITPPSPVSGIDIITELKVPICSIMEREITLGEAEALNLLRACLVSRSALDEMLRLNKLQT